MPVNTCPWKRTCSHGVTGCCEVSKISMIVCIRPSSLLSSSRDPKGSTCECQELWSSHEKDPMLVQLGSREAGRLSDHLWFPFHGAWP